MFALPFIKKLPKRPPVDFWYVFLRWILHFLIPNIALQKFSPGKHNRKITKEKELENLLEKRYFLLWTGMHWKKQNKQEKKLWNLPEKYKLLFTKYKLSFTFFLRNDFLDYLFFVSVWYSVCFTYVCTH